MAFTFSHIIVAPLIYKLCKQRLPLAALIIGSILPDVVRVIIPTTFSHQLTGMFSLNLGFGLLFYLLWIYFYRPIFYRFNQWKIPVIRSDLTSILTISVALLLGNFSHLLWDSLTHLDYRTWFGHNFLAQSVIIYGYPAGEVHHWLQFMSSIVVLPFIPLLFLALNPQREFQPNEMALFSKRYSLIYILSCLSLSIFITIFSVTQLNFSMSIYAYSIYIFKVFTLSFIASISSIFVYLWIQLISSCKTHI